MKKTKKLLALLALVGLVALYLSSSDSTKRYIKHIGKQVPALPYRYFI